MKRIAALILLCAMLVTMAACAIPEEPVDTTPVGTGDGTDEAHADPGLPSLTYGGRDFRIMGVDKALEDKPARDIVYLADNGSEGINEAVHARNSYLEKKYNVNIKAVWEDKMEINAKLTNSINGGIPVCDAVENCLAQYSAVINEGSLVNLKDASQMKYLDLSKSYWDQNCVNSMSIGNALYFASGDIMITDKMGTWAISFNRDLITKNSLENPYDLVAQDQWTYDKMYEMAAAVCDAESHEKTDYFGTTWGALSETSNTYFLWQGCGNAIITKDATTGIPEMSPLSESAYDSMMKVAKLQFDKNVTLLASNITKIKDIYFDGTIRIFKEGHGLFFIGSMTMVEWMRAYDVDFGVLPMPKYDSTQKGYCSSLSSAHSYAVAVPSNSPDLEFTSLMLEAMACESTDTLREAYYNKTLVHKGLRRPEDEAMLNLVFNNRTYDLTLVFDWAEGLTTEIGNCKTETRIARIKSQYDSYRTAVNNSVAAFVTKHGIS